MSPRTAYLLMSLCLGLAITPRARFTAGPLKTATFALAPRTKAQTALGKKYTALRPGARKKDADTIARLMLEDIRSLSYMHRLLPNLSYMPLQDMLAQFPLLSQRTSALTHAYFLLHSADGDSFPAEQELYLALRPVLGQYLQNMRIIHTIQAELDAVFETQGVKLDELARPDTLLEELSGGSFPNALELFRYLKHPARRAVQIDIHYRPDAKYDLSIERDSLHPYLGNSYALCVRNGRALEFLARHSEYMLALIVPALFPDRRLPLGYDIPQDADKAKLFAPFIRLFYDLITRVSYEIPTQADYAAYRNFMKEQDKTSYETALFYQDIHDPQGHFKTLDLVPENDPAYAILKYQYLRRLSTPSLTSPRANEWFERERRRKRLARLTRAAEVLTDPFKRFAYDPVFRENRPELAFEIAA